MRTMIMFLAGLQIDRAQAYFWSKRWQTGEQEAQDNINNGRIDRFDDIDAALDFLDSDTE